jgi:hypothetical protein
VRDREMMLGKNGDGMFPRESWQREFLSARDRMLTCAEGVREAIGEQQMAEVMAGLPFPDLGELYHRPALVVVVAVTVCDRGELLLDLLPQVGPRYIVRHRSKRGVGMVTHKVGTTRDL